MIKPHDIINSKSVFWICISTIIIIHAFTNLHGIGLTYDSYHYLKASQELLKFFELEPIEDEFIRRPPLYPVLLSLLASNLLTIQLFHLVVFLSSLVIYRIILFELIEDDFFRCTGLFLFATSTPILIIHSFVWTESIIMLLLLLQIFFLLKYQQSLNVRIFLSILLIGFIIGLFKRGGVLLIPGMAIMLFLSQVNWKGFIKSTIYIVVAYTGTYSWYYYLGYTSKPGIKIPKETEYLNVISTWIVPKNLPELPREIFALFFLLFCVSLTVFIVKRQSSIEIKRSLLFPCFFITYVFMRWKFASINYYESDRYISIIIPCFLIWLMWLFSKSSTFKRKFKIGCMPLLLSGCSIQASE